MTLAFYKVDNSQNYGRHTFDGIYDKPEKIKEMLSKLSDEELRMYDMDNKYDKEDFKDDYNDEVLDGGWWLWILP